MEVSSSSSFREESVGAKLKKKKNQKKGHILDTSSGCSGVTLMMRINPGGSIFDLKEKEENTKRKGFADAQTMSQPEQQARPSQGGAGVKTQQAQGQNMVDRVELEMGDDPPSRYLADQGVSTGPGVVVGATQCESPNLDGPADEIVSAVRLRGSVIELSSRVKERPVKVLLDSGTTGNFISDAMATALKLKLTS